MRKKLVLTIIFLWFFGGPAARAETAPPAVGAAVAAGSDSAAPPHRGTLYRVLYKGNTSYLFGTIHIGMPSLFPLEPTVTNALAQANKLVLELDPDKLEALQAGMKKYGLYDSGDSIASHISAPALARLRDSLQATGIPFDSVERMRPWMLTTLLVSHCLQQNGYRPADGVDVHLLALAKAQHKSVHELESADYQFSLFAHMAIADQEQFLVDTLDEIRNGEALKKAGELMTAWASADGAAFERLLRELQDEKTTSSEFVAHVMLERRNPEMARKIEGLLKSDQSTFVAVGLLHLVGKNGIPAQLRRRGYQVEKLY